MPGRVTQTFLETTDTGAAQSRVTQIFLEWTERDIPPTQGRVTQAFLEWAEADPTGQPIVMIL
jgi:hypothetical protein